MVDMTSISSWWKSHLHGGWQTGNRYHPGVVKTSMMTSFLGIDNGWKDIIANKVAQDHAVERYTNLGNNNIPHAAQVWVANIRSPE